jgi:hypothetical protein
MIVVNVEVKLSPKAWFRSVKLAGHEVEINSIGNYPLTSSRTNGILK